MNKDELIVSIVRDGAYWSQRDVENIVNATLEWAAKGQEPVGIVAIADYQTAAARLGEEKKRMAVEEISIRSIQDLPEGTKLYKNPAPRVVPANWEQELLDWVSSCQSAYHIESTPDHIFGGIPGALQENREALINFVRGLLGVV